MGPEAGVGVRWVSGLGGEEQTGELPAATVSVHEGQGVLHVVLDHGHHGGEALHGEAGTMRPWGSCWEKRPEGTAGLWGGGLLTF